jgi:hypothetical protein
MSQKTLIITLVILLVASFVFLAWTERQQATPRNWWSVSFVDPVSDSGSDSLDFTITNHGAENTFHYIIERERNILAEEDIVVPTSVPTAVPTGITSSDSRTTITVTDPTGEKQLLYK